MNGTLSQALLLVHAVLADGDVPHALCGGLAANLYREEVRATADVDIAVAVSAARVIDLVGQFEATGWEPQPYWHKAEQLRLTRPNLPRVDCILATTEYERSAIGRAALAQIGGHQVPVLRAEDLIIYKLVAGRARDYEAVAAIINAQGEILDSDYVRGWLGQLGASGAWKRAVEEAEREAER